VQAEGAQQLAAIQQLRDANQVLRQQKQDTLDNGSAYLAQKQAALDSCEVLLSEQQELRAAFQKLQEGYQALLYQATANSQTLGALLALPQVRTGACRSC
jgi:hypothetical protein